MKHKDKQYPEINKVRMLREGIGFSQEYVANKLEISQQAYSKLEKNPNTATLERLRQLSEVLGVSINSIVGDEDMFIQQNFQQQGGIATLLLKILLNEHVLITNNAVDTDSQNLA